MKEGGNEVKKFTKNQKSNLRRKTRLIEARQNSNDNWSLRILMKRVRKCLRQIINKREELSEKVFFL